MSEQLVSHPIVRVVCVSLSPMLQDFCYSMVSTERMTPKWKAWYEKLPRRERAGYTLYRGPNDQLGFTLEMLNAALRRAMSELKDQGIEPAIIGNPFGKTWASGFFGLAFGEFIPFDQGTLQADYDHPTEPKNNIRDGWVPDVRPSRQGRCTRAKFPTWGFTANVYVAQTDETTLMEVRTLFNYAGLKCGLGSYTPAHGGPFGTFAVKEIMVEPASEGTP